ncbi:hypothetical protein [Luteimonas sp. YGD11-2]|uniref:hypothetical protein n=1 Tax=Luteimonas sp. YGD11-2 TaxID=2508168 RepID=UPI00100A9B48|nr:hypothetical protein [Luteimonas sp. YGD11-2]
MSNNIGSSELIASLSKITMGGDGASNGETSWLHAIAKALGEKVGELAESMVKNADKVGSKNEKEATAASAQLTADSQLFSMYMNALSTVLKSIGEGNVAMARKQ